MDQILAHGCHAPSCGNLPDTYAGPVWWVVFMAILLLIIAWLFWPKDWSQDNHDEEPESEHHPYQFDDQGRMTGRK